MDSSKLLYLRIWKLITEEVTSDLSLKGAVVDYQVKEWGMCWLTGEAEGTSGRCDQEKLVPSSARGMGNVTEGVRGRLSCAKPLYVRVRTLDFS